MHHKTKKVLCIPILIIIVAISILPALAKQNVFDELNNDELFQLSIIYENNSNLTGFEIYNQSKELSSEYPFYSYNLALKCRKAIIQKNSNDMAKIIGVNMTIYTLNKTVQDNIIKLQDEIVRLRQNSTNIASEEWLSMAERDLNESKIYFDDSKRFYNAENYNATFISLIKSNFSLYKTDKLIKIANNRNNASSTNHYKDSDRVGEKVVSSWMKDANDKISLLTEDDKRNDIKKMAGNSFNESKQQKLNENYYLSLMNAAESVALAEYGLNYQKYTNYRDALTKSEKDFETANNLFIKTYQNFDVDLPFAELHLEMAKLRLEEAKNAKKINIIPLADIAIRETLIAQEQLKATLDLRNAIDNPIKSAQNPASMPSPFGTIPFLVAMIALYKFQKRQGK